MLRPVKAGWIPSGWPSRSGLFRESILLVHMTDNMPKPRLLIVDDEAEVRGVLNDLLGDSYECTEASSAEVALDRLRSRDYQLVISDITMSGRSGLEVI